MGTVSIWACSNNQCELHQNHTHTHTPSQSAVYGVRQQRHIQTIDSGPVDFSQTSRGVWVMTGVCVCVCVCGK